MIMEKITFALVIGQRIVGWRERFSSVNAEEENSSATIAI